MRLLGVALVAALLATAADAQCVKARRPVEDLFLSDVVFPQEKAEIQLEMIPSVIRTDSANVSALGAAWEYGLTDAWQVEGSWDGPSRRRLRSDSTMTTLGTASIGTKWSFMCMGGSPYDLAIALDVEGGSGSRMKPALILGRDFGDQAAHLFASAVGDVPFTRPSSQSGVTGTLGFFARLVRARVGTLHASAEVSFTGGEERASATQFAPGLLWHSPDAWELGVGYATSTTRGVGSGLHAHIVYEFGGDK